LRNSGRSREPSLSGLCCPYLGWRPPEIPRISKGIRPREPPQVFVCTRGSR
jgi:hypothetical protein